MSRHWCQRESIMVMLGGSGQLYIYSRCSWLQLCQRIRGEIDSQSKQRQWISSQMTTDALCTQFSVYRGGKNTFSYCQCNNVTTYGVRCRAQDKVNIKPTENHSIVRHEREIVMKEKSVRFVPSFNLQQKLFNNESCIPLSSGERSGSAARPLHSLIRPI